MADTLVQTEFQKNMLLYYDGFLEKTTTHLETLINSSSMTSEDQATLIGSVFGSAMTSSVQAMSIEKQGELVDEQVKTEQKKQADYIASIKIKVQQEVAERIKNGGISFEYTYDSDGNLIKTMKSGTAKSTYEIESELNLKRIATEIMKHKKQYGASLSNSEITYTTDKNNVVDKQIAGFDMSNLKEVNKNTLQSIGMIYTTGGSVPEWMVDTSKKTIELLTNSQVDFTKESVQDTDDIDDDGDTAEMIEKTVLTDDSDWDN